MQKTLERALNQFKLMKRIPVDLEYIFKASPAILYKFLTTPACLVRWFCDGVDINGDVYTFSWDGSEENAEVVDDIEAVSYTHLDVYKRQNIYNAWSARPILLDSINTT